MMCFIWIKGQVVRATITGKQDNLYTVNYAGQELILYSRDVAYDTQGFIFFLVRAGINPLTLPIYANIFDYAIINNELVKL